MNRLSREAAFCVALAGLLAIGSLIDLAGDDVHAPPPRPAAVGEFRTTTDFCPPPIGAQAPTNVTVSSASDDVDVALGYQQAAEGLAARTTRDVRVASATALDVAAYGGDAEASATIALAGDRSGVGAAACSRLAADSWFFGEGSSGLGYDEKLILYNPFGDEAVARVILFTPDGETQKANLTEVAVPARSTKIVSINEFVAEADPKSLLAAQVQAIRGRIVAWRALTAQADEVPDGLQFTLGAPQPRTTWYFPEGGAGEGLDERISILNPSQEEATINISLVTEDETLQPPRLFEITIEPRTARRVALEDALKGEQRNLGAAGAVVTSTNGVGLVAERTIWYSGNEIAGVTSEIGAPRPANGWFLGPATASPTTDAIVVLNPNTEAATLSVSFARPGGSDAPGALSEIRIKPGVRFKIPIARWTGGGAAAAFVESDLPVVTERFSYSEAASDAASAIGLPLTP